MKQIQRIVLNNISIALGAKVVLENLNWQINANEHWVITGNNGVGKTLLAECLAGKHRIIKGERLYPFLGEKAGFDLRRKSIEMISFTDTSKLFHSANADHYYQQRFNAFDSDGHLTLREYLQSEDLSSTENVNLLKRIGIYELLDTERIKLSSGQTRKMLIAKAVLRKPKILILDNPYIGLDMESRQVLNNLLDSLVHQNDMTLILAGNFVKLPVCVTHRLHIAPDRTFAQAKLNEFTKPTIKPVVHHQAFAEIKTLFAQAKYKEQFTEIIRFEKVNIKYGKTQILKDLNWRVQAGEKWAVMGENGSGKSTVLSLVYADNPQAYGNKVYLFGQQRGGGESIWEIKQRIGFTSPELHAYFRESITAEKLVLTGFTDTFIIPKKANVEQLQMIDALFSYFDLTDKRQVLFTLLSTGEQRLLLLMRSLVKAPPVLLLDEAFQGLDDLTIFRAKHLLDNILTEQHTLIFISHFSQEIPACINKELRLQ